MTHKLESSRQYSLAQLEHKQIQNYITNLYVYELFPSS